MWRVAPKQMQRAKAKRPGEYDPRNHHKGVCWGWPKECTFTELRVSKVLRACIKSRQLTIDQLKVVSKSLAYAYELKGGKRGGNWECVPGVMGTIRLAQLPGKLRDTNPVNIPTPQQLRIAFTKPWSSESGWHFMPWLTGLLCAHDMWIWGCRALKDHDKIKKAVVHKINFSQGWQCSKYHGGRAKLTGMKKGSRDWWVFRVCMCPGNQHVRPPRDFKDQLNVYGDPTCGRVAFCSTCPLTAWEIIESLQYNEDEPVRTYPKWLEPKGRRALGGFSKVNINDPAAYAVQWMEAQKVGKFDHNSGRKCLANWIGHLQIPYAESVHIHGDLHQVWGRNYQEDVPASVYSIRNQSKDPAVATKALRKLAKWMGRGMPYNTTLKQSDRYHDALLRALGKVKQADMIKFNMPSDDEEEEDEQKMQPTPKPEPAVKPEALERVKDEG